MTFRKSALLLLTVASIVMLAACGSSSHPIVVNFSSPPSSVPAGAQVTLTVTLQNDSQNAGVTWGTPTCSNTGQCGTVISSTTTTLTYQAPVAIPNNGISIVATSVTDPSVTSAANFTVSPAPGLAAGNYVFQLFGQDPNGPFSIAGAFTVDSTGTNITGGEQDFVDLVNTDFDTISGGTITPGSSTDTNLQITLNTNDEITGGGTGTQVFNLTLTDPTDGILSWNDTFASGSGKLLVQNATVAAAAPAGGYAFLSSGFDANSENETYGCVLSVGGIINVDGVGTISGNGSVLDYDDCGGSSTGQTLTGTVTTPDASGRVVYTLAPSDTAQVAYAGYIVDGTRTLFVETSDSQLGETGGVAFAQNSDDVGAFSGTNISGSTYVFATQGQDGMGGGLSNFVGMLTFNSDGSVSGTADYNDITYEFSGAGDLASGTYTVDPTGRVTVSGLVLTDMVNDNGSYTFNDIQFYLDGNGNSVASTMDGEDVNSGPAYLQTTANPVGAFASGAGGISATTGNNWSAVGPVVTTSSAVTGYTDFNYFGVLAPDVALSGTLGTGTGTITGLGADVPANSDTFDFYPIDANRVFGIETDNVQLGLIYSQLQN